MAPLQGCEHDQSQVNHTNSGHSSVHSVTASQFPEKAHDKIMMENDNPMAIARTRMFLAAEATRRC